MNIQFSPDHRKIVSHFYGETSDLRRKKLQPCERVYKPRARHARILIPYIHHSNPPKQTIGLDIGTQEKFITAAHFAHKLGHSLNTLLSVRLTSLLTYDDFHPFRAMTTPELIKHIVEKIRHWLTYRKHPALYIWVREFSKNEHWHFAFHLPINERELFTQYLEKILIEPANPELSARKTRGEISCSVQKSWQLAGEVKDGKYQFVGYWLAAYLGKGEPSQRKFRGKLVNNDKKPVRGRRFGGSVRGPRYDTPQGNIKGSPTRRNRFDISQSLKQAVAKH